MKCMMCRSTPVEDADSLVCRTCSNRHRLHRRGLIERECKDCGEVSEVPKHSKRWRCPCKSKQSPRQAEVRRFNKEAKQTHPSTWADGVASESEAAAIRKFLGRNVDLLAELQADTSRIRARCSNYDTTVAWWLLQLVKQDGKCGICAQRPESLLSLFIDHDHHDGRVRGLLCHGCNVGIGHMGIDGPTAIERTKAVLSYLQAAYRSEAVQSGQ